MRVVRYLGISFIIVFIPAIQAETINGGQLVESCEAALSAGFTGTAGMACHWYVTPCDCHVTDTQAPSVCLPPDYKVERLARTVIEGIRQQPELRKENAMFAANTVLSRIYPCH